MSPSISPHEVGKGFPRVRLRKVRKSDLEPFYEHQVDPVAVAMVGFTSRDREAFMAHWGKILRDKTTVVRTIVCDGVVAGSVESFMRGDVREVGYWLGQEFWGRGIATRALRSFLRIETRRPLYAGVAKHNAGSIRVLEKCGFVPSHEEGGHFIFKLT